MSALRMLARFALGYVAAVEGAAALVRFRERTAQDGFGDWLDGKLF